MLGWIESEPVRIVCPDFADIFEGRHTFESFQALGEIVGIQKGCEMITQRCVIFVMVALAGCVLDGAVHPPGLAVCPGMVRFCEPVFDAMLEAEAAEGMAPAADR